MALDKVIDSAELDANLTAVADAIRTKGGTTEQLSFPDGFVSAVEGIQTGGDNSEWLSILDRSITELNNNEVTTLGKRACANCGELTSVNCANLQSIGENAFLECSKLTNVTFHKGVAVGRSAFELCSIEELILPEGSTIDYRSFNGCPLKKIVLPSSMTSLGDQCWGTGNNKKAQIKSAGPIGSGCDFEFPWTTKIPRGAFKSLPLESIIFPEELTFIDHGNLLDIRIEEFVIPDGVEEIGQFGFDGNAYITKIVVPASLTRGIYAMFIRCSALQVVDMHGDTLARMWTRDFENCTALHTLILRSSQFNKMGYAGMLKDTLIASGAGYVYVPAALVDRYKTETNWVEYASQIRAIEDYPEICGEVSA